MDCICPQNIIYKSHLMENTYKSESKIISLKQKENRMGKAAQTADISWIARTFKGLSLSDTRFR